MAESTDAVLKWWPTPGCGRRPSAGPTAAEYQARYGVFEAAFNVPVGPFDASRWTRAPAVGGDAGEDEDGDAGEDEDGDEVVGTGGGSVKPRREGQDVGERRKH